MTLREKKAIISTHRAMAKPCRNIGTSLFFYCNMEPKKAIKQKYSRNINRNILVGKDHNFPAPLQTMVDVLHLRSDK
jgi:hypothetical protein